jgi:hypothetical protein
MQLSQPNRFSIAVAVQTHIPKASVLTADIATYFSLGFHQSLQENTEIVPRLGLDRFLPNPSSVLHIRRYVVCILIAS